MENALRQLFEGDYPAGMVGWIETAYPRIHAELTERIPADLDRFWRSSSTEQFERALTRWLATHREACALYEAELSMRRRNAARKGLDDASSSAQCGREVPAPSAAEL